MRRIALYGSLLGLFLSASPSWAQKGGGGGGTAVHGAPAPPGAPRNSSAQFTLKRGEVGGQAGVTGRARARAGDCAGALVAFDEALRSTVEPTLYRDRGLCHEKLDNRFPAIDDYRAYLVARPDAPDGDQIRERLQRLEGTEPTERGTEDGAKPKDDSASASGAASLSLGSEGASASASTKGSSSKRSNVIGPSRDGDTRSYDDYAADERRADDAEHSPLREGTGWIFGAFVHVPRYFFAKGGTSDMAYGLGATVRYSVSPSFTFLTEIGYAGQGESGRTTAAGGVLAFGGGELRIPITKYAGDQFVIGGGLGFERYTTSGTRIGANFWSARFRGGFRHVFGPSVAVELLADGGPVFVASDLDRVETSVGGVIGGSFAVTAAF